MGRTTVSSVQVCAKFIQLSPPRTPGAGLHVTRLHKTWPGCCSWSSSHTYSDPAVWRPWGTRPPYYRHKGFPKGAIFNPLPCFYSRRRGFLFQHVRYHSALKGSEQTVTAQYYMVGCGIPVSSLKTLIPGRDAVPGLHEADVLRLPRFLLKHEMISIQKKALWKVVNDFLSSHIVNLFCSQYGTHLRTLF